MKLLQACDRPISIISDLMAGIKLIPTESLVRSVSNDSAHESRSASLERWIPEEKIFIKTISNVLRW